MHGYLIATTRNGRTVYVGNNPGVTGYTWVHAVQDAKVYPTIEAARADLCPENERIVQLDSVFAR